jgi:hypothetical protein
MDNEEEKPVEQSAGESAAVEAAARPLDSALRSQVEQEVDTALAEAAATTDTPADQRGSETAGSGLAGAGAAASSDETASDEEARKIMLEEMNQLAESGGPAASSVVAGPQAAEVSGAKAKPAASRQVEDIPAGGPKAEAAAPASESRAAQPGAAGVPEAPEAAQAAGQADAAGSTPAGAAQAAADEKASGKEKPAGAEAGPARREDRKPALERESRAKAAEGGKATFQTRIAAVLTALWRWPLRAGVLLINLLDKPFARMGPDTRDLLGKVGIVTLLLALLMVVAALIVI